MSEGECQVRPAVMSYPYENPTVQRRVEPLTENGFTVAEELEILRIVERMHRGEEKMYSSEEVWKRLGLDD